MLDVDVCALGNAIGVVVSTILNIAACAYALGVILDPVTSGCS